MHEHKAPIAIGIGHGAEMCIRDRSYLCDNTTDVYAAVKALKIGDKIDAEGFLYWYEGVNPHITAVTPAAETTETDATAAETTETAETTEDTEAVG